MSDSFQPAKGRLVGRRFATTPVIDPLLALDLRAILPIEAAVAAPALPPQASGATAPAEWVDATARAALGGQLGADAMVRLGDGAFYLPTLDELRFILDASALDRRTWLAERFDCDDFSYCLKGEFSVHAYDDNPKDMGFCVGMVWETSGGCRAFTP